MSWSTTDCLSFAVDLFLHKFDNFYPKMAFYAQVLLIIDAYYLFLNILKLFLLNT
ncbi:hypothetical protein RCH33_454 [Flavobacterium daejeonense]|nr:hypothetical protein RCH33_454 [Flavobacterium daejeonense]